ncbi:MAG: prevent-host-death protein [bacterium]|nr:prevent-host-death protein [bacterium]
MQTVRLKALRDKLPEYIALAESGETVQITDRGRVVVELVSPRAASASEVPNELIARGVREGWITLPTVAAENPPPSLPVAPLRALLSELERDRADR